MATAKVVRHYGMDWLRIAAFASLIGYHIDTMFAHPAAWIGLRILLLAAIYALPYLDGGPGLQILVGDWYRHALYFTMFATGFGLAKSEAVWIAIRQSWIFVLALGVFGYGAAMFGIGNGLSANIPAETPAKKAPA